MLHRSSGQKYAETCRQNKKMFATDFIKIYQTQTGEATQKKLKDCQQKVGKGITQRHEELLRSNTLIG